MLHFHYFKNTILRFIAALAILACVSMTATLNAADAKPKPNPDKKPAPKVEPKAKPDAKAKPANKPIATVDADKKANPKAAKKPEPAKQPTAEAKAKADDKDKAAKKPKAKDKTDAEKKARKKKRAAKGKGKGKASAKARPAPTLVAAENNEVTIPKKAFGREYLMSGSVIPQSEAATSTGLAGKIVRFELFHDGVDLYESTQGLVVTDELPARRLITTFPITKQDEASVTIDFNKGMRRVFNDIWYSTSGRFSSRGRDSVAELTMSRVFSVKKEGKRLTIRQAAQVRDRQRSQNEEARFEIRYFISPYIAKKFAEKENTNQDSRYVRFFETQTQLELSTGRAVTKIARFELKEPIKFYYRANTPADYEQAVKDGILYWNRAFGKEIITAQKAPANVTAPDAGRNLVQWVPWDSAGFAYADILVDPRTGESRRGQAYMTSVFAISSKARARRMLRAMQEIADKKKKDDKKGDDKDGDEKKQDHNHAHGNALFPASSVCQIDRIEFARQYAAGIAELLVNDELTDKAVLMASQDYVREVVAHEVGHVLGLRHNFGGSLAATMNHKELGEWFKIYLAGGDLSKFKDKLSGNSMMEYTAFKGSAFVGWKIRATDTVLPHDKAAIQWGYFDKTDAREKKMLFATDDDMGTYGDVHVFDYGVEPVVGSYSELASTIDNLPNRFIEDFIAAKAPRDPRDTIPLEAVNQSPASYAFAIRIEYNNMLKWFRASSRSLKVENQFPYIGSLNRKDRVKAHWHSLTNQITKLGGVDNAFFAYLPAGSEQKTVPKLKGIDPAKKVDAKALQARLVKLLDSPAYKEFTGLDDKKHSFTKKEKELIIKRGEKFFAQVEKEFVKAIVQTYERTTRDIALDANEVLDENDVVTQLEKRIIALAKVVITTKDEKKKISGKLNEGLVTVTDYKYDLATRQAAARSLSDTAGSFPGWSKEAKGKINAALSGDIAAMLNSSNLKSFNDSMLTRPLREWYLKQQTILKYLPKVRPPTPAATPGKK